MGSVPTVPPLGAAFDPLTGVWQMTAGASVARSMTLTAGVGHDVTVSFDAGGVPTITAATDADAMYAEGYVTARYRLLEMDLERRLGEGTLSAVLGSSALASDELQLSLGLTRTAQAEWDSLGPSSPQRQLLVAYSKGVNLAMSQMEASHQLPAAMTLLDYRPAPWTPVDTLVVQGDLTEELDYTTSPADMALLERHLGSARTAAWFPVTPTTPQAPYDPGPYVAAPLVPIHGVIPGTTPTPGVAVPPAPGRSSVPSAAVGSPPRSGAQRAEAASLMGWIGRLTTTVRHYGASNNWVVAPSRSANGQALLANDPHLPQTLPSVWYEVAIDTPDLRLAGVEAPGLPGILLGRNDRVAWGFTDTQNQATLLYRETLSATNPSYYRWRGRWHALRTVRYHIAVAGGASVDYPVRISVHGPLVSLPGGTYALWWAGDLPNQDLLALVGLWHARDAAQVRAALQHWTAPTQNIAYADSAGHVGIIAPGVYPETAHGVPWLPLSGTGADDVVGTIPPRAVPQVADPVAGYAVSANQRPVTAAYPYYIGTVYDFFDPGYRALTISSRLAAAPAATTATMASIETDLRDRLAVTLTGPLVAAVRASGVASSASGRAALALLTHWDGTMSAASGAAALYWTWLGDYARDVFGPWWRATHVPVGLDANLAITPATDAALVMDLETWSTRPTRGSALTLPDGHARSAATVMAQAFTQAVAHLTRQEGPPVAWRWDHLQSRQFASLTNAPALGYGPRGSGGDAFTPDAADGFPIAGTGPSWREIIALGPARPGAAPATSTGVYPGGQSENPLSPWYETWVTTWWDGRSHPLPNPTRPARPIATWELRP